VEGKRKCADSHPTSLLVKNMCHAYQRGDCSGDRRRDCCRMHQRADGHIEPGFIAYDQEIQRQYEVATNKTQAPAKSDESRTVLTLKEAPAQTGPAEEARVRNTPATGSAETAVPSNGTSHLPKEYLDMLEITVEKLKDEDFEMVCTQASKEDIDEFEQGPTGGRMCSAHKRTLKAARTSRCTCTCPTRHRASAKRRWRSNRN
jgi:hypothetical protein